MLAQRVTVKCLQHGMACGLGGLVENRDRAGFVHLYVAEATV